MTRRKPEILTMARAKGLTKPVVDEFFSMYEKLLKDNQLDDQPGRIFNLDETGLTTDRVHNKVYVAKGSRDAYLKSPVCGKSNYSVLFCVSATGLYLPPFTVYKSKHLYDSWTVGGPEGSAYGCTESGWMMDNIFESWFLKVFIKQVETYQKPVLLTYDGHNSHLTYNTVRAAMDHGIIIVCLPPNTSHALQPLDVGVFRSVKSKWKKILDTWYTESRLKALDKTVFPSLLSSLWPKLDPQHAVNGFRGAGLWPADRSAISRRLVINDSASSGVQGEADVHSPRQQLRLSILKVISPPEPPTVQNKARKRVQHKSGEILTSEEVLSRLEVEANERNAKKAKKDDKKLEPRTKKRRRNEEAGTSKSKSKTNLDQDFMIFIDGDEQNAENIDPLEQHHEGLGSVAGGVGDLQEGESFVIVQYEGSYFPGKVVTLGKNSVTVSCMVKSGITTWRWPDREDFHKYHSKDVVKQIAPPSKCNSRGSYSVPEAEEYWE